MRRSSILVVTCVVGLLCATGCSGSSSTGGPGVTPGRSVNLIGDPSDTASPVDTSTPMPTDEEVSIPPTETAVPTGSAAALEPGEALLSNCLDGNWTAPVSREFDSLGLGSRSGGAVRGGTGLLRLTFGRDRTFTFTYEDVSLDLAVGTATVTGPVSGTWSLAGSTLATVLVKRATEVKVHIGPVSIGVPSSVAGAVEALPPSQVLVTCGDDRLLMQIPSAQGGGTITLDRA